MKQAGLLVFKSIYVGLAVLLCSLLMLSPTAVNASTLSVVSQQKGLHKDDKATVTLAAGESVAGEAEGLIQLNKFKWTPFFKAYLILLYPQAAASGASPNNYPASKGDCGLHTILTKGP